MLGNYQDAEKKWKDQNKAYQDALKIIEDGERVIQEQYGDVEEVEDASVKFWQNNAERAKTAVSDLTDAMNKLDDYVTGVHDAVEKAIESTVSGFEKVTSPAQNLAEQLSDLKDQYDAGKLSAEEFEAQSQKLNKQMNEQGLTTKGMIDNLKSQAAFMSEYMRYLEEARAKGVSNDVLAELSDGSTESVDRLRALTEASDEDIATINELYGSVQDKKNQLADALTQQKLKADDVYESLAQTAKDAVAALDLGQEAADNAGKTVQGLAEGIASNVDSVQSAVDAILAQLNRLNGWGINIDFGGFGNISFTTSAGKTEGSGRMGWDYIPHDDFIMRAHEGEGLLNAEENRIWHNIKMGGFSTDEIEALSGAMGASIKPGGNVYLDGRIVGQVISDQQGKSYRALARSGWQGGK